MPDTTTTDSITIHGIKAWGRDLLKMRSAYDSDTAMLNDVLSALTEQPVMLHHVLTIYSHDTAKRNG